MRIEAEDPKNPMSKCSVESAVEMLYKKNQDEYKNYIFQVENMTADNPGGVLQNYGFIYFIKNTESRLTDKQRKSKITKPTVGFYWCECCNSFPPDVPPWDKVGQDKWNSLST